MGAQYREATRAKSNADFISKIEGSLQELEETDYWLELLGESGFFPKDGWAAVRKETGELKGIFVSMSSYFLGVSAGHGSLPSIRLQLWLFVLINTPQTRRIL